VLFFQGCIGQTDGILKVSISRGLKIIKMVRTITEILKEADSANKLQVLINLWNEIANNKKKYPLVEIWFANEHLRELVLNSDGEDFAKGRFYMHLNSQVKSDVS
jgi:hypothetical protein